MPPKAPTIDTLTGRAGLGRPSTRKNMTAVVVEWRELRKRRWASRMQRSQTRKDTARGARIVVLRCGQRDS
jgi:hypothetical protein